MSRRIVLDTNCLLASIVTNSEYIVSNDAHFDVLATIPFPHVFVLKIDEFLAELSS